MIGARVAAVQERIARAAARAGRRREEISLLAVSKTHPPQAVRDAYAAGIVDFAENKVQEAETKIGELSELRALLRWHLVGHLQSNKARKAATLFDRIHSVDSIELVLKLEHATASAGKTLDVFAQVDLAGEATKHGADERQLFPLLEQVRGLRSIRAVGLMILPPLGAAAEASRPFFVRLRELRDKALADGLLLGAELSMGMSHDFEVAIEEGATTVRVGTALFGERKKG